MTLSCWFPSTLTTYRLPALPAATISESTWTPTTERCWTESAKRMRLDGICNTRLLSQFDFPAPYAHTCTSDHYTRAAKFAVAGALNVSDVFGKVSSNVAICRVRKKVSFGGGPGGRREHGGHGPKVRCEHPDRSAIVEQA